MRVICKGKAGVMVCLALCLWALTGCREEPVTTTSVADTASVAASGAVEAGAAVATQLPQGSGTAAATASATVAPSPLPELTMTPAATASPVATASVVAGEEVGPVSPGLMAQMLEAAAEIPDFEAPQGALPLRGEATMSATVSAEEEAAVRRFLAEANVAEVVWGWTLETTFAEAYFSEALVDVLEAGAADYRANDLRRASLLDEERSYFVAVWAADGGGYEAGVCEWWEVQGYRLSDGAAVGLLDRTPRLVAQTVRVQEVDGRWLVTDVVGHEGVGFCE